MHSINSDGEERETTIAEAPQKQPSPSHANDDGMKRGESEEQHEASAPSDPSPSSPPPAVRWSVAPCTGGGLEGPPRLEIAPAPGEAEGWEAAPSPGKAREWGEWGESAEWAEVDLRGITLTKEIARGSSSVVYRGVYRKKNVAVKVVDLGSDDGSSLHEVQDRRAALIREVIIWSRLSHPHIVPVIGAHIPLLSPEAHPSPSPRTPRQQRVDSRLRGEQACVVSALIGTGVTLKEYLARTARERRKLPLHMLVDLAMQLAKSLAFLHSLRVVHGDVCPDHVLLDSTLRLHLAGFACASIEGDLAYSHAGRGEERGNPNYMAPEVLNSLPYDRQADVFSFGMCLWSMLSCEPPFPKCDYNEISDLMQQ
ncbi:unnamed protein product, partial [Closterium sp. Yama58-4]